jgi:hypothetical protein
LTITVPDSSSLGHAQPVAARGTWYAWYVVFILTGCYTLAFVDSKIPGRPSR